MWIKGNRDNAYNGQEKGQKEEHPGYERLLFKNEQDANENENQGKNKKLDDHRVCMFKAKPVQR